MKGIPIKFRGKHITTGTYVYGWACKQDCPMSSFPAIIDDDDKYNVVYPDSVAQLVCYDINGNEVYEGDTLVYDDDFDYDEGKVSLVPTCTHGYIELDKKIIKDYNLRIKE